MTLKLEGYEALAVDRGEDALTQLQTESYDLILLDLNTNGMSALDFMQQLNELCATQGVSRPVVAVLSGSTGIEFETRRIGAQFSIRKPFEYEDLVRRIREIEEQCFAHVARDATPSR